MTAYSGSIPDGPPILSTYTTPPRVHIATDEGQRDQGQTGQRGATEGQNQQRDQGQAQQNFFLDR